MKVMLIVNATASSVTARTRVVIQKALASENEVTLAETTRRGHASRLAQSAVTEGYDAVVVLGGDGTLNEAINGLAGSKVKLGVLPGGSTNVFARAVGITNDPIEATAELIDAMSEGNFERIGLGKVNGRYFCFHVGVGFDAEVVARVERRGYLKRYAGHPWFAYTAIRTAARGYDRKIPKMNIEFADGSAAKGVFQLVVLKLNPYTYLGPRPFNIAPEANIHSKLAAVALHKLNVWPTLRILASAIDSGKAIRRRREVTYKHDLDGLTVAASEPIPYQVDGDHLGEITKLEFEYVDDAISLFLPRPLQRH